MNYIALYRKWRPMTFDEVVEQQSIVTILKNAVKSRRIAHAYLFCGTRGTGKTTIAKIFSRAVNCISPVDGNPCNQCDVCRGILNESLLDVSEIDAASNNGVDSIRAIIDESNYQSAKAEYKVFIIDEVHMLSTAAFNALLKTLEEPPEKVIFILATTEPHKLPVTILSRCQRYDFKRISRDGITARLEEICQSMNVEYEEAALRFLAGKGDGAMRDSISLLDKTISACEGKITLEEARKSTGSLDRGTLESFASALISRDSLTVLTLVDQVFTEGADPSNFICELIGLMRSMMIVLSTKNPGNLIYETGEDLERLKSIASGTTAKELTMMIRDLSRLENDLKWSVQRKIVFEAGMLSLCDRSWSKETDVGDRMETLEHNVADLVANGLKIQYKGGPIPVAASNAAPEDPGEKQPAEPVREPKFTDPREALTRDNLKHLNPVPEADWKDFLDNLSGKFSGVRSMLTINAAKGYLVEDSLFVSVPNANLVRMITNGDRKAGLEEAASNTFDRKVFVQVLSEEDFYAQAPEILKAIESKKQKKEEKSDFEKAGDVLRKTASQAGVPLEVQETGAPAESSRGDGDDGFSADLAGDPSEEDRSGDKSTGEENPVLWEPEDLTAAAPAAAGSDRESADEEEEEDEPDEPEEFDVPPPDDEDVPPEEDDGDFDPDRE